MPITRGSVFAGSAIATNADPVCRTDTGSRMPPSRDVAALPPATASSATSSVTLPEVPIFRFLFQSRYRAPCQVFGTYRFARLTLPTEPICEPSPGGRAHRRIVTLSRRDRRRMRGIACSRPLRRDDGCGGYGRASANAIVWRNHSLPGSLRSVRASTA
jgi:hypothetical protein